MLFKALKDNFQLTIPILLTRLLGITSNLIAMLLIAGLGTAALSASALIMGIFSICVILIMSFSFSVCALVAEECGKQNEAKVGSIILTSLVLNTLLAIPFMVFFYHISVILIWLNQPPEIANLAGLYFQGMLIGYLPMIWSSIIEQFLVGTSNPRYIVYLSLVGLVTMPLLSFALIFGHVFPPLGMLGAGYAVSLVSIISFIYLITLIIVKKWNQQYSLLTLKQNLNFIMAKTLLKLGWPISIQFAAEFSAYFLITLMMGWLGVVALASQQVVLQFATVFIMVPTSVSQATSVLVAQARAGKDEYLIKYRVNVALMIISILTMLIGLIYVVFPGVLIRLFLAIDNPENVPIFSLTSTMLLIAAIAQFFDGVKIVLSGAYRGLKETKRPMMIGTSTWWLIGIPLAYYFGFVLDSGAVGVRWGFTVGIILSASLMIISWYSNKDFGYGAKLSPVASAGALSYMDSPVNARRIFINGPRS